MIQTKLLGALIASVALLGFALTSESVGGDKSESQVKTKATASKIDAKGNQTVEITLDIAKGWHLYANPVNATQEFLESAKTKATFAVKGKTVRADVKYPVGKQHVSGKDKYDIYTGTIKIEATVLRTAGDTNPLEITIAIQACDDRVCLQPGKVKLTVP